MPTPRLKLHSRSSLVVSAEEFVLGQKEPLLVSWDIREDVHTLDWVGLYRTDETDPQKYLDKKEINKGHATSKQPLTGRGGVLWPLGEAIFNSFVGCSPDDNGEATSGHHEQVVASCFRYYHGPTAVCRAVSPVVQLCRTSQAQQEMLMGYSSQQFPQEMLRFTVTNLHAQNLKRNLFFSPDPYVKMSVQPGPGEGVLLLPHHGQVLRTAAAESTVNPRWTRLQFEFIAYPSDVLEFEVKDKFSRPRPLMCRFLGKLRVSVQELVAQCGANHVAELSYPLVSRNPGDPPISGHLLFSFFLETVGAVDPWLHIRQLHNPVLADA
ncbi:E3 ubiquitin-protein ligase HECW1-like, partial [Tropilaelaps mercedesae]